MLINGVNKKTMGMKDTGTDKTVKRVFILCCHLGPLYQFPSPWYDLTGDRTHIYHTRGEHANRYTTDPDDLALQLNTKVFWQHPSYNNKGVISVLIPQHCVFLITNSLSLSLSLSLSITLLYSIYLYMFFFINVVDLCRVPCLTIYQS